MRLLKFTFKLLLGFNLMLSCAFGLEFSAIDSTMEQNIQKTLALLQKNTHNAPISEAKAQEIALRLENITLEFLANAGEDGRMFGTISTKQVALKLKEEFDIEIDKRKIISKVAVDRLGYTTLEVELYKGVIGKIRVHVSENK